MSPLEIEILLHYYARTDDHPIVQTQPPVWGEIRDSFIQCELLEYEPDDGLDRTYRLGERGAVFVDALTSLPVPEKKWVMP